MNPPQIDLNRISTEQRNPRTMAIDTLSTQELVSVMHAEDATIADAIRPALPAIARGIDGIVARLSRGGRLISIGAGTSGRLGVLDASECPPTFNTPPGLVIGLIAGGDHALRHAVEHVEDDEHAGAAALQEIELTAADAVVGIAASGRTPFVLGAMAYARQHRALTLCITNSADSALEAAVDIPIVAITGPEVVTGSTRLKAGTAQKLILNMLSTGTMIKLGKTYGNLMVDVQPTNAKLRVRARRIVSEATGLPLEDAAAALDAADGDVKAAIVAALAGVSVTDAQELIAANAGSVRRAIEGDQP